MAVCILCGVFARENEQEVIRHARAAVEFSANLFQEKLIGGFAETGEDVTVLSAPFIGSYPNASDILVFSGFEQPQDRYTYVGFHNLWGYRNISRAKALKKALEDFIQSPEEEKLLVVYCAHTPFLEAAYYAKRRDPSIRVCLYVPDLPDYMNLSARRSRLYDFAKKYDIAAMKRYMACVDGYVLLTEEMKGMLPVGSKPYLVIEGIVSREDLKDEPGCELEEETEKFVVYTGKLSGKFGVKALIDSFALVEDPACRLILCGTGDCFDYAREAAARDERIRPLGQIPPAEAKAWQRRAAVLVNPRPNDEEYTKYSFPSKNIEYLLTGRPVAAYLLDGMPRHYREFLTEIPADQPRETAIAQAIGRALEEEAETRRSRAEAFRRYAREQLAAEEIAEEIRALSRTDAE